MMTTTAATLEEPRHTDETIRSEPLDLRCTFDAGAQARRNSIAAHACPYPRHKDTRRHRKAWLGGWWAEHNDR